jgi:hypothetical protein
MFAIDSGDFLNNPLSFGLTLRSRFACMFLTFRDHPDVKQIQTFCHTIFSGNRRL